MIESLGSFKLRKDATLFYDGPPSYGVSVLTEKYSDDVFASVMHCARRVVMTYDKPGPFMLSPKVVISIGREKVAKIRDTLERMGADLNSIYFLDPVTCTDEGIDTCVRVGDACREIEEKKNLGLVVIDFARLDMIPRLIALAARTKAAVLMIPTDRDSSEDLSPERIKSLGAHALTRITSEPALFSVAYPFKHYRYNSDPLSEISQEA